MELKNRTLSNFAELVRTGECKNFKGRLKVGVDLGTANTVLAVVDNTNRPIAGISAPSRAIRDGVIVNFYESVQLVTKLKAELEEKLKTELPYAAAAIPPGVSQGSTKSIQYVLEGAGFEVTNIVDEPTAAAAVLKITDGAVVDVGGGTTGISILKDGKVIYTDDEATGGSHMTMTVAGHYNIPYEEAEILKTDPSKEDEIFPVIKATVEKWLPSLRNFSMVTRFLLYMLPEVPPASGISRLYLRKSWDCLFIVRFIRFWLLRWESLITAIFLRSHIKNNYYLNGRVKNESFFMRPFAYGCNSSYIYIKKGIVPLTP